MFFSDDQLTEAVAGFKDEAIELLDNMEAALLEIQEEGMNSERINAVFRAAHTIKGSGGMLKLDKLVSFTHIAENLLDDVRNNKIEMTEDMLELFLECKDHMQNLIMFYTENLHGSNEELDELSKHLMGEMSAFVGGNAKQGELKVEDGQKKERAALPGGYEIDVEFGKGLYTIGMDPSNFIRFLQTLGKIESIEVDTNAIPVLSQLNPKDCYIKTHIELTSKASKQEVEDVFEFIKEDIKLAITSVADEDGVDEDLQSGENQESDKENEKEATQPSTTQEPGKKEAQKSSSVTKEASIVAASTLRVDSEKIDHLINLIGEMVIANANVVQKASVINNDELNESISAVSHMLEEIRESAMKIRMVQIGETFSKFKRIVHDVSKKLHKDVDLIITGGETELDKTIVEKLNDPLVHIVRNAMDHGIESTDERINVGKKAKGRLELNAYHDAGSIAIEIKDDGKGLNEEKILSKAMERGLVEHGAKLTPKEIFNLIFEPGFSTADQITDLSGRGVGMDVVKRNITALRGSIDIKSEVGKGSCFTIRLPLTLAIVDGFLVRVGRTHYVVPLDMVLECVELPESQKKREDKNSYINLRGLILPILSIREFFGERGVRDEKNRENVVVVQSGGGARFGLIVEELLGEFQTVIKPLGKLYQGLKGIGGATILGSGEIALIMDIPALNNVVASSLDSERKGYG